MSNVAQQIQDNLGVNNALFQKNLKGAGSWDELANGMEVNLQTQIASAADLTKQTWDLVHSEGMQNAEFVALSKGIMRDLQNCATQYGNLVARRDGRVGVTKSPEEHTEYLSIGLELTSLSEEMTTVVGHAMVGMTEFHNAALDKARARIAEQDTVTDVEVKEPVPELTAAENTVDEVVTGDVADDQAAQ